VHQHFGEWELFFQIIAKNVFVFGTKGLNELLEDVGLITS